MSSRACSAFSNYSPPIRFNYLSEQGMDLLALLPVPCLSGSCLGGEGHGRLVYQIYLVYKELCLLVHYTCPIVLSLISGL